MMFSCRKRVPGRDRARRPLDCVVRCISIALGEVRACSGRS